MSARNKREAAALVVVEALVREAANGDEMALDSLVEREHAAAANEVKEGGWVEQIDYLVGRLGADQGAIVVRAALAPDERTRLLTEVAELLWPPGYPQPPGGDSPGWGEMTAQAIGAAFAASPSAPLDEPDDEVGEYEQDEQGGEPPALPGSRWVGHLGGQPACAGHDHAEWEGAMECARAQPGKLYVSAVPVLRLRGDL